MSLRNAKSLSIKSRLILFYSLATIVLLALVAVFLYWTMLDTLHDADHQFISAEIDILQYLLDTKPDDLGALKQEVNESPYALRNSVYRYYIRILDNQSNLIIETVGMKNALRGIDFRNTKIGSLDKISFWAQSLNGDNYLLMESTVIAKKKSWLIQAALDVSYQQSLINNYKIRVVSALIIGVLFSILLGYVIVQRSMRRLEDLTETTENITSTSLHQRSDPLLWPKELRTLGIAFNQMLDRVEASFSRLKQFSGDLAHELRTPISNMMGETELALLHASSVEDYQKVLESNLEELHRISHLIENLLFLAHTENPQLDIKKVLLKADEEIAVIAEFHQAMAEDKNINITCHGKAALHANPVMFRRMINNILTNALKYTERNGEIEIAITELDNQKIQIAIKDNGIGIAAEHLPNIFNRFYRVDSARSQASGGVGLGLAIVESIVDLHQGSISITSRLGVGSTVFIVLPK